LYARHVSTLPGGGGRETKMKREKEKRSKSSPNIHFKHTRRPKKQL